MLQRFLSMDGVVDVDKDYIVKLINILKGKKCELYLNNYDNKGKEKSKQWIKNGFPEDAIYFYTEEENEIKYDPPKQS